MTKPVRLDREAEQELEATHRWYEDRRVGLGDEFLESVREILLLLEEMTGVGSPVPGMASEIDVRRIVVRRFPYSVVFLQLETETRVVAVAHDKRRPMYWRKRLT